MNVLIGPVQFVPPLTKEGVTVMLAITGTVPLLIAVNEAISPAPFAASPMLVLLLTQL